MSEQDATQAKSRLPRRSEILSWAALIAAAAALLPINFRGKPKAEAVTEPPKPTTPEDFDEIDPGRGRCATAPWEIPGLGWKDILWRTWREMGRDRLPALAGSVTFYVLLAVFPAIAAFVSLYGLFSNVDLVERQLQQMSGVIPPDVVQIIGQQMVRVATTRQLTLSAAFFASVVISVWGANAGMKALMDSLNITYDEAEKRDYLPRTLVSFGATLTALILTVLVAAVLVAVPIAMTRIGLGDYWAWWIPMRWAVVWVIAAFGFMILYRYGPSRSPARWRWVVVGGFAASTLWMAGSLGFSWYLNNIVHLQFTYGSLGAVVAFMLWVWFSVMVLLSGAEFNSEIEHQTAHDTTTGEARPLGERGAVMADTIGYAFKVSPREAVEWVNAFSWRQVGYVASFVRRKILMQKSG